MPTTAVLTDPDKTAQLPLSSAAREGRNSAESPQIQNCIDMTDTQSVTVLLVALVTVMLVVSYGKYAWRRRKMPPGPFPLPILGNYLQIQSEGLVSGLVKISEKYGPIYTVYMGSRPCVVLSGYQAIKEAIVDMGDAFLDRGNMPLAFRIFNNSGLAVTNGETWKQLRQFSLMTLKDFGMGKKSLEEPIQEEAQHLVEHFKGLNEQPYDPSCTLTCATSNILLNILIGTRHDYNDKKWMQILEESSEAFHIVSSKWGQEEKTLNTPFNMTNLSETVFDMFLGGSESTTSTVNFGLLILIKYPELQDKLHEEIDRVIGQVRQPRVEDRNQMPYMNAVLHEIQRISNVFPMGIFRCTTRDVNFRGFCIPKGTDVITMLTTVLQDPAEFETPGEFNINHFLDESGKFKKINGFLPFSAGKRSCVGESLVRLQLFIFFTVILQKFTLKSTEDPKDLNISPVESGLESIPPSHKIIFISRV
ncbi:cytochrome P450 2F2-like isoform X2 [Pseudophryne corroboree]|uniref:cytochrome P450 2F2-like isoform X2 n=1 Tax=Pseudophryne corroboree TaxID=495146 RepID=UPI003081AF29